VFEVLAMYAFYSLDFTFGKAALFVAQPIFLIGTRMTLAGIILLTYVYFFKRSDFRFNIKNWFLFIQAIVLSIYFGYIFDFWGMQHMTSSKNALIFTLSPFITACIAYAMGLETLSRNKLIGLIIGFSGALTILIDNKVQEAHYVEHGWFVLPELACLFAVASIAYGWIIFGRLHKEHKYSTLMINGICMFFGGLLALGSSPFFETWNPVPVSAFKPFAMYTIFLIVVGNIIVYNWYIALLRKHSMTFVSFVSFTIPLYTSFYSWLWLGEIVTWQFFVALIITACGLYIFYRDESPDPALKDILP